MPEQEAEHFSLASIFRSLAGPLCPTFNDFLGKGRPFRSEALSEPQEETGDAHQSPVTDHLDTGTYSDNARSSRSPSVTRVHPVTVTPAPSQMKNSYSGWKPYNSIDGQLSAAAPSSDYNISRGERPARRPKRPLDDGFESSEDQNPPRHTSPRVRVVPSGKRAKHVHSAAHVNRDDMEIDSVSQKNRLSKGPSANPRRAVIHTKRDRGSGPRNMLSDPSINGKNTVTRVASSSRLDRNPSSEANLATPVRLIDYDTEFDGSPGDNVPQDGEPAGPSASHAIGHTHKRHILLNDLSDPGGGVRGNDFHDDQRRQNPRKESIDNPQKYPVKTRIATLSKQAAPTLDRQSSPRLSETFRRDTSARIKEEGETDELVQSSPVEFVRKRLKNSTTPTQLGAIRERPNAVANRDVVGTLKAKDVLNADIPLTRFVTSNGAPHLSGRKVYNDKDMTPTKDGICLESYFHETAFAPPLIIYPMKSNGSFQIIDQNGRKDSIFASSIKKATFSGNGVHVRLDSPRSEKSGEGLYHLVFAANEGLQKFQLQFRVFASGVPQMRETDTKLQKMFQTRLAQHPRAHPASKSNLGREEENLLKRRVENGKRLQPLQSAKPPTAKLRETLLAPQQGMQRSSGLASQAPGVDEIIYEDPSDRESPEAKSRPRRTKGMESSPHFTTSTSKEHSRTDLQAELRRPNRMETRSNNSRGSMDISYRTSKTSMPAKQPSAKNLSASGGLGSPWAKPLLFPIKGLNKTEVEYDDLKRLDEDEFLNDNLVQFGLRYVQEHYQSQKENVYVFNTYFYTSLTKGAKGRKNINYDAVKRWTSKIDLFDYNYIIVPINESFHWYVAIICNLRNIRKSLSTEATGSEVVGPQHSIGPSSSPGNPHDPARSQESSQVAQQNGFDDDEGTKGLEERTSKISLETNLDIHDETDKADPTRNTVENESNIIASQEDGVGLDDILGKEQDRIAKARHTNLESKAGKSKMGRKGSGGKKYKPDDCVIITLDSFGYPRPQAIRNLKDYLREEAGAKRGMDIEVPDGLTAKGIAQQKNFSDCGLFLIVYVAAFFQGPSEFIKKILARELDRNQEWPDLDPSQVRRDLRQCITEQYERQNGNAAPAEQSKLLGLGLGSRRAKVEGRNSISTTSSQRDTVNTRQSLTDKAPSSKHVSEKDEPGRESSRSSPHAPVKDVGHKSSSLLRSGATCEDSLNTGGQQNESIQHNTPKAVSTSEEQQSIDREPVSESERKQSTELSDLEDDPDKSDNPSTDRLLPQDGNAEPHPDEMSAWRQQLEHAGQQPDGFEEADFMPFGADDVREGDIVGGRNNMGAAEQASLADSDEDNDGDGDETTPRRPPTRGKALS